VRRTCPARRPLAGARCSPEAACSPAWAPRTLPIIREYPVHFREHSVNFREHSVNFREHSVNFREHSVNFREHSVNLREHSVNFREHSVNFREPSVSVQAGGAWWCFGNVCLYQN
jgi:hypothetical protein